MFLILFSFFIHANYSCEVSFLGLQSHLKLLRKVNKKGVLVRFLNFPTLKRSQEEYLIGTLPAYVDNGQQFEEQLKKRVKEIFHLDDSFYARFRLDILESLFELNKDTIHFLRGSKQFGYLNSWSYPFNSDIEALYKRQNEAFRRYQSSSGQAVIDNFLGHGSDPATQFFQFKDDHLSAFLKEGRTIRTLIADEWVFEGKTVKMVLGDVSYTSTGRIQNFHVARSPDNLNLSLDYLVRAGIVSERAGGKPIEMLVVGTQGITEDDIRKRIDKIIGDGEEYSRLVGAALPNERHSALMGGIGLSAGYHRHTKNFIFNLRTGVDRIWGKFKQTGPQSMDTESVPRLGWGITVGTGLDYKFTEKSTIGLEGGVRFSEFKIPQQADPKTTKSSWFMAPYAQIVCGFYPTPDYSISVFTGYFFPRTFMVKTEGTKITEGTQCKVDGIFGGLRFARYF